jgi:hypothetical protein
VFFESVRERAFDSASRDSLGKALQGIQAHLVSGFVDKVEGLPEELVLRIVFLLCGVWSGRRDLNPRATRLEAGDPSGLGHSRVRCSVSWQNRVGRLFSILPAGPSAHLSPGRACAAAGGAHGRPLSLWESFPGRSQVGTRLTAFRRWTGSGL